MGSTFRDHEEDLAAQGHRMEEASKKTNCTAFLEPRALNLFLLQSRRARRQSLFL